MKIGIVGCGKQAPKHIAGLRSGNTSVDIVVCDVHRQAADRLAKEQSVHVAGSLEDMLQDSQLDGVIIATPTPFHYEAMVQVLQSGKPVFCEKPLCETQEQLHHLEQVMQTTGQFVQVGYVYRQVPAFRALKKILDDPSQPLGRPVKALLRIGGRGSHSAWKHKKDTGGGAVNEMLVHMLDLAFWLFGDTREIYSCEQRLLAPTRQINGESVTADAEDFVLLSAASHAGVQLVFQADLLTPTFRQYIEVQGTNGSFIGSIQSELPAYMQLLSPVGDYAVGRHDLASEGLNLFNAQMQFFLTNVRARELLEGPTVRDSVALFNTLSQLL